MSSARTFLEIVQIAVAQAGRGPETYAHAKKLANNALRHIALNNKYPALRKIGAEKTLNAGSTTSALPADFGAGSDNILFGTDRTPIYEREADEFVEHGGIQAATAGSGRPSFYMVDKEAASFRFNRISDTAYSFIPVYFKVPDLIPDSQSGDNTKVWYDNDLTIIQGIIWQIYIWKEDPREHKQKEDFEAAVAKDLRGVRPISGGGMRIRLAPGRFR